MVLQSFCYKEALTDGSRERGGFMTKKSARRGRPRDGLTRGRIEALAYLRACLSTGEPVCINDLVFVGAFPSRWSAKRCLRWAAQHLDLANY